MPISLILNSYAWSIEQRDKCNCIISSFTQQLVRPF